MPIWEKENEQSLLQTRTQSTNLTQSRTISNVNSTLYTSSKINHSFTGPDEGDEVLY
jgi:hypothetical protein